MDGLAAFEGAALADIGAGGGYHACLYARRAARVVAVEPAPLMLRQLYARIAGSGLTNISVLAAGAEDIPLRDGCLDVIHSRFAYFFGPEGDGIHSCEPGIREALRLLRPGGHVFIVDNALTSGQFAGFLGRFAYAKGRATEMQARNESFYRQHGFEHETLESTWTAPDRETLRRVIAMEFPAEATDAILAEITGSALSYHYRIYYRRK